MAVQVEEININLITKQHIILDMEDSTQKEVLHVLIEIAFREGKASGTDTLFQELYKWEQECTAGFEKGIAILHARHTCIKGAEIPFVRMKYKMEWKSIDEKPVEATVCLLALDDKHDFHLRVLLKFARRLVHEDFVDILKTAEKRQILDEIIDAVSWRKNMISHGSSHMI